MVNHAVSSTNPHSPAHGLRQNVNLTFELVERNPVEPLEIAFPSEVVVGKVPLLGSGKTYFVGAAKLLGVSKCGVIQRWHAGLPGADASGTCSAGGSASNPTSTSCPS